MPGPFRWLIEGFTGLCRGRWAQDLRGLSAVTQDLRLMDPKQPSPSGDTENEPRICVSVRYLQLRWPVCPTGVLEIRR